MITKLHELYEEIYSDLKQYISENSIYEPKCKKVKPNEISTYPLVTCVEGDYRYRYTTLKHTDEIYDYNVMEINIFAQNKGNISGVTIKDEIRKHIETYFQDKLRLQIRVVPNAPNVDDSIYRCVIYVSCKVDTKYKDKLILSPR